MLRLRQRHHYIDTECFSEEAEFKVTDATATDLAVLDPEIGQVLCNGIYGEGVTLFNSYLPTQFVAHSIYKGTFTNIPDMPDTYELIERCTLTTGSDVYTCVKLWDSTESADPPHLPCCGEENTLTVQIEPVGGGKVTSDDGKIDCPGDCSEKYGSLAGGIDGCPPVVLTATTGR